MKGLNYQERDQKSKRGTANQRGKHSFATGALADPERRRLRPSSLET